MVYDGILCKIIADLGVPFQETSKWSLWVPLACLGEALVFTHIPIHGGLHLVQTTALIEPGKLGVLSQGVGPMLLTGFREMPISSLQFSA